MKVKVNKDILVWAREELNLSQEVVANKMGRKIEEIQAWENGTDFPTYVQLEKLSYTVYKKPLAIFFFPEPPKNIKPKEQNFRTLNNEIYKEIPTQIIEMMNKARVMQLNLKDIETSPKIKLTDLYFNIKDINFCEKLRDVLNISIELQKKAKNYSDAFEMWRSAFYECGVYVFKDAFKEKNFSGFCLYDKQFPVIYINNSMSFSRQIFTLFHELFHIIIKTNGIDKTNDDYLSRLNNKNREIETLCNSFAGEFLVPTDNLKEDLKCKKLDKKNISNIAKKYKVSREVIYRKLLNLNIISKTFYESIHDELNEEILRENKKSVGGNYYSTQKSYLGENYIYDVCKTYYSGKINIYELSNYLNVKVEGIPRLGIILKEGNG